MAVTYLCNSSVRGYHVYQSMWSAEERENLVCKQEMSNPLDSYAVILVNGKHIVGHLPRNMCLCAHFLGRGGSITIWQGGLEIPCHLTFSGLEELITKVRSLMYKLFGSTLEDSQSVMKTKK